MSEKFFKNVKHPHLNTHTNPLYSNIICLWKVCHSIWTQRWDTESILNGVREICPKKPRWGLHYETFNEIKVWKGGSCTPNEQVEKVTETHDSCHRNMDFNDLSSSDTYLISALE